MADEQYQDEDRSAAKTLWLGDVQVRAPSFSWACQRLPLVSSHAWDFQTEQVGSSSPPPIRWIPNGCQRPGSGVFGFCGCRRWWHLRRTHRFASNPLHGAHFNRHDTPTSKCDFCVLSCCPRRLSLLLPHLLSRAQQPEWTEEYVESLFSSIGEPSWCPAGTKAVFKWVDLVDVWTFVFTRRLPTLPA